MIPLTLQDFQLIIAVAMLAIGILFILLGTYILVSRSYGKEIRALAAQTARLGQKGIGDEISGLVSSASELVLSINQLVKTANGIGVFLIAFGTLLVLLSYWVTTQIAPTGLLAA